IAHRTDTAKWASQSPEFAQAFGVDRYDARGFGRSDNPAAPFAFHEDLKAVLASLDIPRAFLMGCSGGGATVIDMALAYPDSVVGLVLVGSAVSGYAFSGPQPPKIVAIREARERGDIDDAVEVGLQP